jgi:hypothetical protein
MISETVMAETYTEKRKVCNRDIQISVISPPEAFSQSVCVIDTKELLARLRTKGVINADIARALSIKPSAVTELFKEGGRKLKLDEAVTLVETFELERAPSPPGPPLPAPVSQLIVQHIALELGRPLPQDAPQLQELAEDLRAFSEYVTDPKRRESLDLAEMFFEAMRIRRPASVEAS